MLVAKLATGEMAFDDVWWGGMVKNPWNIAQARPGLFARRSPALGAYKDRPVDRVSQRIACDACVNFSLQNGDMTMMPVVKTDRARVRCMIMRQWVLGNSGSAFAHAHVSKQLKVLVSA